MMRATVTPKAKVRPAVMMTVSPSRWQAQSSVKGSVRVSRSEAISWLARSDAEDGRRCRRADFRNTSGSEASQRNQGKEARGVNGREQKKSFPQRRVSVLASK